ncbi:ABC transporter ATP-binding protein [Amycolatopsis sp. CA-230715]|uniref:ABC transporter ATP-binding protein n=1 Tax=Amycolatopsis sp. CA-230715 TaxID=2745196 RepID=UPI001C018B69|nr:ABC transporter ATP-binding protein [Amycolatopsis sp. CA-230715]QWF81822.1 putative ABC transporter ATP-binding protein YknY [Amycolatopsis sp. CA-230715]
MTEKYAIEATGLTKIYGAGDAEVIALDHVDLAVPRGRFTAIMGPSGSGKSTFMHCAAGLDRPTSGEVLLGGTPLSGLRDNDLTDLRRERVGFVFQSFNLLPTLTALENITLPLDLAGRRPDRELLDRLVVTLGIEGRLDHRPNQLSGGQQQRVACARALVTSPDVVFADEPTGALDSEMSAQLLGFLRDSVTELGQTVVMVTHDPGVAEYTDEIVRLADGRVTERAVL